MSTVTVSAPPMLGGPYSALDTGHQEGVQRAKGVQSFQSRTLHKPHLPANPETPGLARLRPPGRRDTRGCRQRM